VVDEQRARHCTLAGKPVGDAGNRPVAIAAHRRGALVLSR
jgi:hypothetical protein